MNKTLKDILVDVYEAGFNDGLRSDEVDYSKPDYEQIEKDIRDLPWVSVEERLPEEGASKTNGDSVWIRIEYKDGNKSVWYERGWYNHRVKKWQSRDSYDGLPVTHWLEITPPRSVA